MTEGSNWEILKGHDQYKISNIYPYEIRKMKNDAIVKPFINNGYYTVHLTNNKLFQLGRVIAEHFIPNPDNLPQVNHKDGNKENNRVDNLEWCDNSYNQRHAFENGLQKGNFHHPNSKLTYNDVMYIKKHYVKNKRGNGVHSLANKFGVCDTTIKQILRGDSYKNIK